MTHKSKSKCKSSGVEWIGDIPRDWKLTKYKYLYQSNMGQTILKEDLDDNGVIPVYSATESGRIFGHINNPNVILESGDIVIPARGNSIGFPVLIKVVSTCTQTTIYSKKIGKVVEEYVYFYLLGMKKYLFQFDRTAIPQITVSQVSNNLILLPPEELQLKIVCFLNEKLRKLDSLLLKKRQTVDLLEEKRQAVITVAVTKGLNPNVPMKDSGVEWIGEIPAHWEIKKIRYLGRLQNGISKAGQYFGYGSPFISYGNVYNNIEIDSNIETGFLSATKEEQNRYSVKRGDVFFTRTSETVEEIAIASTCIEDIPEATFAGFLIRFRPSTNQLQPDYGMYYFGSELRKRYFIKEMNLVTRASLGQDLLKNYIITLPPINEQKKIAEYLNKKMKAYDEMISNIKVQIQKLNEYRESLIYEAVTGKIDLRDYKGGEYDGD